MSRYIRVKLPVVLVDESADSSVLPIELVVDTGLSGAIPVAIACTDPSHVDVIVDALNA